MAPTSEAHVPIRTCVGCGRRRPQAALVRLVLVDGAPLVEPGAGPRRAPGRGAWLCGAECLPAARKRAGFRRAWRVDVPAGVLDAVESALAKG